MVSMCATNDHVCKVGTPKENDDNSLGEDACEGPMVAALTKYLDL